MDEITKSIIVKGELSHVYGVWKNFTNFPRFMKSIESITPRDDDFSHWVMREPLEWDAKTTRREENIRITWKSIDGDLKTSAYYI